jgi:CRISPR-associated protein Cas5h
MKGLRFDLEAINFCCFRKPLTTSTILTYNVPPFTTLRGILSNAMGKVRDDLSLQDRILIGVQTHRNYDYTTELARQLKMIPRGKAPLRRVFPSSPMRREFLIKPSYTVYVLLSSTSDNENNVIEDIKLSLDSPKRPLYLGQSDDFVDISNITLMPEVTRTKSRAISSILQGIYRNCDVTNLPYKFEIGGNSVIRLQYITFSVPEKYPFVLDREIDCFSFGADNVFITAY